MATVNLPTPIPLYAADQVSVTSTPAQVGGKLQGQVGLIVTNFGSHTCYLYATTDGSTPWNSDVINKGEPIVQNQVLSTQGLVSGNGDATINPQFWVATSGMDTTSVSWTERIFFSEERA